MPNDYDKHGNYIGWSSESPDSGRDHGKQGGLCGPLLLTMTAATALSARFALRALRGR